MIQNLKRRLNQCKECPLYKEIMCFPNVGCGNENADIMFIIGGVDRENLIFEKPFNELSETVLLKCLDSAKVETNRCYITSIIKCGSLKDKKSYIETCSKWLIEEINEVKPKVLFFLGKKTFEHFNKLYPNVNIKIITEPQTLYSIFSKNSLMSGFVEKIRTADEFCKRFK